MHIQPANDVIRAPRASGQPADADYSAASGGRMQWPPSWKYDVKSTIRLHQSIKACLLEEQSCQIPSWSDLKRTEP